ncbi:putative b(0,+)-type amino acid transporter 1 isoform X2 [Apostichopus japonicus]|uniref:b(0,+)-type amino acid transporter 1 n=2 Tax=Stichopus japonicus TaxID=307972 RepID=A0A2G8K0F1_STIJA|nr:putative b(0,+)-type amino acid transporter 1 isoform X2 [Apostichopus japonicus]
MIGSGIFISPKGVLRQTNSVGMSLVVWAVCGAVAMLGSLSYAELGTMMPTSGGEFSYMKDGFGPPLAFMYSWVAVLLIKTSSLSAISTVFGQYAAEAFYSSPECPPPVYVIKMLTVTAIVLLIVINCISSKSATSLQVAMTAAKLFALVLIICVGIVRIFQGHTEYISPSVSFDGSSTRIFAYGIAFYQGLWAYDGWNQLNYAVEELQNPYKNLPRAVMIGIPLVTIVYLLTNIAYFTVLSPDDLLASNAVAVTFANRMLGPMAWIIPLCVCFSTFGASNGILFTAARLAMVCSREGHMISIVSMVNVHRKTPMAALIFEGVIAIVMVIPNDFDSLVNYFSFTSWMFYGLSCLAHIVLRFTHPEWKRPIRIPLVIPLLVVIFSIYLVLAPVIDDPSLPWLFAALFVLAGLFLYFPFVKMGLRIKPFDYITLFMQQLLQSAPSKFVAPEDDSKESTDL